MRRAGYLRAAMPSSSICLIANPAAGRGRASRLLPALRNALAAVGVTDIRLTSRPHEERDLARAAAAEGVDTIVALGGDGTWGNVARGILESGRDARLAIISGGTGNDLAYATGVPAHDPEVMVRIVLGSAQTRIDVGCADGVHFLNVAGFGFDADVLEHTTHARWLRGPALYQVTAAQRIFRYAGFEGELQVNDAISPDRRFLALIFSNGPRFGGGYHIAPLARIDDGLLDGVIIRDASPWRRALLFARAKAGRHVEMPEVSVCSATAFSIRFAAPPRFDADGELHTARASTVEVSCLPGRLRFAVAG
jgi:diacylglycerol kinase (ATP)